MRQLLFYAAVLPGGNRPKQGVPQQVLANAGSKANTHTASVSAAITDLIVIKVLSIMLSGHKNALK